MPCWVCLGVCTPLSGCGSTALCQPGHLALFLGGRRTAGARLCLCKAARQAEDLAIDSKPVTPPAPQKVPPKWSEFSITGAPEQVADRMTHHFHTCYLFLKGGKIETVVFNSCDKVASEAAQESLVPPKTVALVHRRDRRGPREASHST